MPATDFLYGIDDDDDADDAELNRNKLDRKAASTGTEPYHTRAADHHALADAIESVKRGVRAVTTALGRLKSSSSGTPAIAGGAGAGTGPTVSVSGNDNRMLVTVTTGTTPGASGDLVTITFAALWTAAPKLMLAPANAAAAALTGDGKVYASDADVTTALCKLKTGATALAATTTYKWWLWVLG